MSETVLAVADDVDGKADERCRSWSLGRALGSRGTPGTCRLQIVKFQVRPACSRQHRVDIVNNGHVHVEIQEINILSFGICAI